MNRNTVRAEFNTEDMTAERFSWPATSLEVLTSSRTTRSSKPEIIYHLGSAEKRGTENWREEFKSPIIVKQPVVEHLITPVEIQPTAPPQDSPVLEADYSVHNLELDTDTDSDSVDEVFSDSTEDMSEDRTIMPPTFGGTPSEDGDAWVRHFLNYCRYREYNNPKALALLKVLLTGSAAVWLEALPEETVNDYDQLRAAFDIRYKTPEIMKFRSAKEIFSKRQGATQSCDDYISEMRKLANNIQADEKMTRYAILNGLRSDIAAYVTQQKPKTMDELLEAARIAELTNPKPTSDSVLSQQLADVQMEVRRLASKWDKVATAPVFDRRSPTPPTRRVTFNPPPVKQTMQRMRPAMNRDGGRNILDQGTGAQLPHSDRRTAFNPQQTFGRCQKCGRNQHVNLNYCPAINRYCNHCGKRGHFSVVCRAATRIGPQGQSQFRMD